MTKREKGIQKLNETKRNSGGEIRIKRKQSIRKTRSARKRGRRRGRGTGIEVIKISQTK